MWLLAAIDPEPRLPATEASIAFLVAIVLLAAAITWIRRKPSG